MTSSAACVVTTEDSTGSGAGGGGNVDDDGNDGPEEQVDEGPPGSVGNECDEGTCVDGLICGTSQVCQPEASDLPAQVVQAVPPADTADVPSSSPIMLFFDGQYANIEFTAEAHTLDGIVDITDDLVGTLLVTGAEPPKDVYIIAAKIAFPLGASIVVSFSGDVTGTLVFNVDHNAPASADGALDFEGEEGNLNSCDPRQEGFTALPTGWKGFGDVGVVPAGTGSLGGEGERLVAMSSGSLICGSALTAAAPTTSVLVSGGITMEGEGSLSFDYNFQSSEFDDYCASAFDDTLLAVLAGPQGVVAEVVDSVNIVCADGTATEGSFPGAPDGGDEVYKQTGTKTFSLVGDVGSPARVAVVLTDVGDFILSSVVGLDGVSVGQ
jgi:hypothetical protein